MCYSSSRDHMRSFSNQWWYKPSFFNRHAIASMDSASSSALYLRWNPAASMKNEIPYSQKLSVNILVNLPENFRLFLRSSFSQWIFFPGMKKLIASTAYVLSSTSFLTPALTINRFIVKATYCSQSMRIWQRIRRLSCSQFFLGFVSYGFPDVSSMTL